MQKRSLPAVAASLGPSKQRAGGAKALIEFAALAWGGEEETGTEAENGPGAVLVVVASVDANL